MGASIINDISAGSFDDKMFSLLSKYELPYVVMHMKGIPTSMQKNLNTEMSPEKLLIFLIKKSIRRKI